MAKEYDAWEHLCSAIFPEGHGIIVMSDPINIYCDATYNQPRDGDDDAKVYLLASCAATVADWKSTRKEWRQELAKWGVSHFHMSKFVNARKRLQYGEKVPTSNPFAHFKLEDFDPFFERLMRVMNRKNKKGNRRILSKGISVLREEFLALRPEALEQDVRCANLYVFHAYILMMAMALWADENKYNGQFFYMFSHGDVGQGQLTDLFRYIIKRPDLREHFRLHYQLPQSFERVEGMPQEPAIQIADIQASLDQESVLQWHQLGNPSFIDREISSHYLNLFRRQGEIRGYTYRQQELIDEFHSMMLKGVWTL